MDKRTKFITNDEIKTVRLEEIPHSYWLALIRHFQKEEYIFIEKYNKADGGTNVRVYLSIYGLPFLDNGGFSNQYKRQRHRKIWVVANTIAAILNALIIIVIAIWSLFIADKSEKQGNQIKAYQDSIQKLNSLIKYYLFTLRGAGAMIRL